MLPRTCSPSSTPRSRGDGPPRGRPASPESCPLARAGPGRAGIFPFAALGLLLTLAWGCGLQPVGGEVPGKPAYADLDRLTIERPGWNQVKELEGQIERLRSRLGISGSPDPEALLPRLPSLAPASAAPEPEQEKTNVRQETRQLAEGQVAMLRSELARTREEKLTTFERGLRRQAGAEIAAERRRQQERLWQRRQQVLERFSRSLLSQRTKVESLPAGDPRRSRETERLAALEAEQQKQLAALQSDSDEAIAAFTRAREADLQDKLAAFRADLVKQEEQRLAEARAHAESRASEAEKTLATALEPKAPPELHLDLEPLSQEMAARSQRLRAQQRLDTAGRRAELTKFAQLRDRLKAALRRETADTATALAAREGYRVVFSPQEGRNLPDITQQLSRWLARWSRSRREGE